MSEKSETFDMRPYDMFRLNFPMALLSGDPEFITMSVFVENAGIDGEFHELNKEKKMNYCYGTIIGVEERQGPNGAVNFRLMSIQGRIKFVININETVTVNSDESVSFFHRDDFSAPFFKRKLRKGTYTLDFEPINDERYSVTFTTSSAQTDHRMNAARNQNNDAGHFPANAEIAAVPAPQFPKPAAGNAALWEKLEGKKRAADELAKTDKELFEEIQALNKRAKSIYEELEKKRAERRRLELAADELENKISEEKEKSEKLTEKINNRDRELIELRNMYESLEAENKKDYPGFAERKAELESKFTVDIEIVNYYMEKGEKPLPIEALVAKVIEGIEALEEQIRVLHRERETKESD
jgi:hypothetical protein